MTLHVNAAAPEGDSFGFEAEMLFQPRIAAQLDLPS
jgi:hypothetical protein